MKRTEQQIKYYCDYCEKEITQKQESTEEFHFHKKCYDKIPKEFHPYIRIIKKKLEFSNVSFEKYLEKLKDGYVLFAEDESEGYSWIQKCLTLNEVKDNVKDFITASECPDELEFGLIYKGKQYKISYKINVIVDKEGEEWLG